MIGKVSRQNLADPIHHLKASAAKVRKKVQKKTKSGEEKLQVFRTHNFYNS